jgi:hypothetical protein
MSYIRARRVATVFTLVIVLAIAVWMRTWRIDRLPPGFHFDEAYEGVEAWRILTDSAHRPLYLTDYFGIPPLNAYANALTFGLFEAFGWPVGPTAMRLTAAAFGVLGVVALYLLAAELRRLDPVRLSAAFPFFAAGTLALMRWHVHFSRVGIEPILVPLLWALATWGLLRGWRTRQWPGFVICGIALGLGMYAYMGAWVTPLLMIPMVGHLAWHALRSAEVTGRARMAALLPQWRGALVAALVAVVVFAPLAWFFWQQPQWLLMRPTQLSIVGTTTSPADSTVWDNLWRTAKMFGPLGQPGDPDPRRNIPGAPALNVWFAIPFYLGVGLALWRIAHPAYSIVLISLLGLLLPGIFSEYAPHFHRILGGAAPTALLCAVGFDAIWRWRPRRTTYLRWASVLLIVLAGATSAYHYFGRWAALPDLFYAFDVGLWEMGQWMVAQPDDSTIYLTPRSTEHPTLAFAWQTSGKSAVPASFDGRHVLPFTHRSTEQPEQYAVVEHEDFRTRLLLPGLFPDVQVVEQFPDDQGHVYAQVYERPAGSLPQLAPQFTHKATVGDGIALMGYDVQPSTPQPGDILYVQYHWRVTAPPSADWTVFTHVLHIAPDGTETLVAGFDSPPGAGTLPTSRWQPGWRILDEYQVSLPAELAADEYTLRTGLYRNAEQGLLPLGEPVTLGTIEIGS